MSTPRPQRSRARKPDVWASPLRPSSAKGGGKDASEHCGPSSSVLSAPRINEAALPRDYCQRIGSQWIGYPTWQLGSSHERDTPVLSKAEKKCAQLLKDLMKRKGGSFFEFDVDPSSDDSGSLDDYFDKVADPVALRTILNTLEAGLYHDANRTDAWVDRVALDVEKVWKNAEVFNPAGHVVYESAKELRSFFDAQFDNQVRKELPGRVKGEDEKPLPLQLALTNFAFVNAKGNILSPVVVMQRGFKDVLLVGDVMRNRQHPAGGAHPTKRFEAQPLAWHYECEQVKEGASCRKTGKLVVWVQTERSWIRLLEAAPEWQEQAWQWMEQVRLCCILCVCAAELPREAPDRILRQVVKSAMAKGGGKLEEDRLHLALVETAELAAVDVERLWLQEGSKLSAANGKRLINKLLKDAEKERARCMLKRSSSQSRTDKDDSSIGCALSGVISRIETDALRASFGLKDLSKEEHVRNNSHPPDPVQQSIGNKRQRQPSGTGQVDARDAKSDGRTKGEPGEVEQGHWERDAEGKRVWVAAPVPSKDSDEKIRNTTSDARERTAKSGGARGSATRKEGGGQAATDGGGDSAYAVGGRVRVIFDDGEWYVGKLQARNGKKWHVMFGNEDEDDMKLPDPDAVPVPPLDMMLTAVDQAFEAVETALQDLCESKASPKTLKQELKNLKAKLVPTHQRVRKDVADNEIGSVPVYTWSVARVQREVLEQAKASLISDNKGSSSFKQAQWASVEKSCKEKLQISAAEAAEAEELDRSSSKRKRPAKDLDPDVDGKGPSGKKAKLADSAGDSEAVDPDDAGDVKGQKTKSKVWKGTPEWLEPDSIVEVECDGEWWQAKAVLLKKGKIKFEFVGGSAEDVEWLPANSARIRPSEGTPIEGVVGERVQAKRPKDKGELKDSWNLAVVVDVKDDDEQAPMVKVKYLERRGVRDEWLTIDTVFVRKLEGGEGAQSVEVQVEDGPPWPQGTLAFENADKDSFSNCLLLMQFLAAFGHTPLLLEAVIKHEAKPVAELQTSWASTSLVRMLQIMSSSEQDEYVMDLMLRLVAVLVKQDSTDHDYVAPNSLNFLAWLRRLVQKEMFERGRRILNDRIEEAYTAEYVLEKAGLSRAALNKGKGAQGHHSNFSIKGDDMGGVEGLDGLEVEVTCSEVYMGITLSGLLVPANESGAGVQVTCHGISMSLSDFAHFAQPGKYAPPLPDPKTVIRVKETRESLVKWEAKARAAKWEVSEKSNDQDDRVTEMCVAASRGSQQAQRTQAAVEKLLGAQFVKEERELISSISNNDWAHLPTHIKWRAVAWLCEAVAESESMRAQLQEHIDGMTSKSDKKGTSGFDLFVTARGGQAKNTRGELLQEWERSSEAAKTEWNEKAKAVEKEQKRAEKLGMDVEGKSDTDKFSSKVRHEPIGVDRQHRRYWLLSRSPSDWLLAVELRALKPDVVPADPYPLTGTNRKEPFESAPEWRFYAKAEELVALMAYLEFSGQENDTKLLKRIKAEFHSVLPAKVDPPADTKSKGSRSRPVPANSDPSLSESVGLAETSSAAEPAAAANGSSESSSVKTEGANAAAQATGGQKVPAAQNAISTPPTVDHFDIFPKKNGEYLAVDDETPRMIASKFGIDVDAIVQINKHMYDGLHAGARFKGGTLVFLPTPVLAGLKRPAVVTPKRLLEDISKVITCQMEVLPMCPRIEKVLESWKVAMQELLSEEEQHQYAQRYKALAHVTLTLEHTLALPALSLGTYGDEQPAEQRPVELRLVPAHWIADLRQNWILEMESVSTMAQMGLLLEEFHLFALAGFRDIRAHTTSIWYFQGECRRLQRQARGRARATLDKPLVHVPEHQEQVVYFCKGHQRTLADPDYSEKPWDASPDVTMSLCTVEEKINYRQSKPDAPCFCALRLRPLCQGKDLVNKKIFLHNTHLAVGQPLSIMSCSVEDFRQTTVDVPHLPPGENGVVLSSNLMTPGVSKLVTPAHLTASQVQYAAVPASTSTTIPPTPTAPVSAMDTTTSTQLATPASTEPVSSTGADAEGSAGKEADAAGAAGAAEGSVPSAHAPTESTAAAATTAAGTTTAVADPQPPKAAEGASQSQNGVPTTGAAHSMPVVGGEASAQKATTDEPNPAETVVYTQRTVNEYLIRWGAGFPDQWVNLDQYKYSMQSPEEGGSSFWVTVHYEQKHPEFLLKPREFAQQNMRWKPKTRVRMFWRDEENPAGGEYYSGQVVEHDDGPDPWDSVHVKWDVEEGEEEDHDWVCPWELQVCHGEELAKRSALPEGQGSVVRNAQEAAQMPRGGFYTATDDDSPLTIAQKRGLDVELIVLLNKEELKGLTKYSKLLFGTKVRLPPKGYRYQRSGGTVISTSVDGTAELQFPKEDEVFWEGPWTNDKRKVADCVLRKITRQRGIGPFLTPVDYEERGLDDYITIVKTPMDLGTVESRLYGKDGEQEYELPKEYYQGMKLVFENAKLYNPQGSDLHRKAVQFLNHFEDWWRDEKSQIDAAEREENMRKRKLMDKESAHKKKKMMGSLGQAPSTPIGLPVADLALLQTPVSQISFNMTTCSYSVTMGAPGAVAVEANGSERKNTVTCGICGADGHNRRTCPKAAQVAAYAEQAAAANAAANAAASVGSSASASADVEK